MDGKQSGAKANKPSKKEKQKSSRRQQIIKTASSAPKIWWRRFRRDYKPRFIDDDEEETKKTNEKKDADKRQRKRRDRFRLLDKHLTIDQLAAKRKLEQLKLLTRTDLSIANSAEPYRVSGFVLFKSNLYDPVLYVTVTFTYLLSKSLAQSESYLFFILLFSCFFMTINYHIESYRSFKAVNRSVEVLSQNIELRKQFLSTHLGYNPKRKFTNTRPGEVKLETRPSNKNIGIVTIPSQIDEPEYIESDIQDTFHWINMIIVFFWPYLSHIIHYELNTFFRDQIESGSLAHSDEGMKRLFYAILRQLDTNILVIEKCQLGHQAPFVKSLTVHEAKELNDPVAKTVKIEKTSGLKKEVTENRSSSDGKTLVYNVNLEYNGDMNIAVIYRYFCCCSSRMGLKDVFLRFKLRCTVGPIKSTMPFIEQIKFTLLELPEFGYKGIALAELAELKIVRGVINRLIVENLLFPREITVSLGDLLKALINGPPPDSLSKKVAQTHKRLAISEAHVKSDASEPDVPFLTRMTARLVLCGCMCSNIFIRCCSKRDPNEADDENEDDDENQDNIKQTRVKTRLNTKYK